MFECGQNGKGLLLIVCLIRCENLAGCVDGGGCVLLSEGRKALDPNFAIAIIEGFGEDLTEFRSLFLP